MKDASKRLSDEELAKAQGVSLEQFLENKNRLLASYSVANRFILAREKVDKKPVAVYVVNSDEKSTS